MIKIVKVGYFLVLVFSDSSSIRLLAFYVQISFKVITYKNNVSLKVR